MGKVSTSQKPCPQSLKRELLGSLEKLQSAKRCKEMLLRLVFTSNKKSLCHNNNNNSLIHPKTDISNEYKKNKENYKQVSI